MLSASSDITVKRMKRAISKYMKEHGIGQFSPKAVLFDMDGVLLDSMGNHAIAWERSMKECGLHMTKQEAYATEGQRGVDTIRYMVKQQQGRDITEAEAQKIYDVKTRVYGELPEAKHMKGIEEVLMAVKEGGLQIVIVTGSGQKPLIERLSTDFAEYVSKDKIITAYDVERGKPAPDPYLAGLRKAGNILPTEAIVVENAPLGVRAGVAAGIFTVAVNTGPLSDEMLEKEGANVVYPDMRAFFDNLRTILPVSCLRDMKWKQHCEEVKRYVSTRNRRPSKYKVDDHRMVNWIKFNRKLYNQGRMSEERRRIFEQLLSLLDKVKHVNQHA